MSHGFIIGPMTLADGQTLYMTAQDDQTITAGDGNYLVADFGQGGTISVGNGNSELFATKGGDTITAGNGDTTVLAGVNSKVTIGSNTGGSNQSVVLADKGSSITVGDGTNIVFLKGTTETLATGNGEDVVFALGTGSNTVSFGSGMNWAFLHDYNNVVNDGAGTDTVWLGAGGSKIVPNAAGGTEFVYNFNASDHIDLGKILAGLNLSLTASSLSPYVSVSQTADALYPTLKDTLVSIKETGGTANVWLMDTNAGSLQTLLDNNQLGLPATVTL